MRETQEGYRVVRATPGAPGVVPRAVGTGLALQSLRCDFMCSDALKALQSETIFFWKNKHELPGAGSFTGRAPWSRPFQPTSLSHRVSWSLPVPLLVPASRLSVCPLPPPSHVLLVPFPAHGYTVQFWVPGFQHLPQPTAQEGQPHDCVPSTETPRWAQPTRPHFLCRTHIFPLLRSASPRHVENYGQRRSVSSRSQSGKHEICLGPWATRPSSRLLHGHELGVPYLLAGLLRGQGRTHGGHLAQCLAHGKRFLSVLYHISWMGKSGMERRTKAESFGSHRKPAS